MKISSRNLAIIIDLLKSYDYISYDYFIKKYDISERTLRNDLSKIDKWLTDKELPILIRNKFEGIYLDLTNIIKNELLNELLDLPLKDYAKDSKQRCILMMLMFLNKDDIKIANIKDKLNVSRNTILKDLEFIEEYLKDFSCSLKRIQKKGIVLTGSEFNIRNMYIDFFMNICLFKDFDFISMKIIGKEKDIFYDILIREVFKKENVNRYLAIIESLEEKLELKYADESKNIIIISILITIKRIKKENNINFNKILLYETLKLSNEYKILKEVFKNHEIIVYDYEKEVAYISLYLLTKRVLDGNIYNSSLDDLKDIVIKMIDIMQEYTRLEVKDKNRLIKGLVLHLEPAIYRIRYNIKIENDFLDEIKSKYLLSYNASKLACSYLSQKLNIEIPKEEIGYIAIHFGSALNIEKLKIKKNIALICNSGMSTVRILEKSLKENFYDFNISKILSYFEYKKLKKEKYDLFISTIKLNEKKDNIINVSPFLQKEDIDKLSVYLKRKTIVEENIKFDIQKILNIVKKHANIEDEKRLKDELLLFMKNSDKKSLLDLIDKNYFNIVDKVDSWKEAIDLASKPLLSQNIINQNYIKKMKENIIKYNAYVVIKKNVAIPHSKIEDGALNLGFSLLIIKEGINFNHEKNDPVNIVLVTSQIDKTSHLRALEEFFKFIKDDKNIKKLKMLKTYEDFLDIFKKHQKRLVQK